MIHIITESTADLSPELKQKYQIETVPLLVVLKDQSLHDGVDIDLRALFNYVNRTGELPKTAAAPLPTYIEALKQPGDKIFIGLSSNLSASFQNATLAAKTLNDPSIHLIDSLNLSTGIGLLVLMAAELRDAGMSAENIAVQIRLAVPRIRSSFVIDSLDYLHKGGRCSSMQNIIGSLLKIRPVIEVKSDGTLGVKEKLHGARKKALLTLIENFKADLPNVDMHRIFITHTLCDDDALLIRDALLKICTPEEICITYAGSVIASHCGPNTLGILYMLK